MPCGFSDVTVLSNALYAQAGLVGYSGPHYSSFGMKHQFGYTEAGFRACVMEDGPITLAPSPDWSSGTLPRSSRSRSAARSRSAQSAAPRG